MCLNLKSRPVMSAEGYFGVTLPAARSRFSSFAVLRLDGDIYQSTWEALENLYPYLNVGGYVIIDDYTGTTFPTILEEEDGETASQHHLNCNSDWSGCRAAVDDFRRKENVSSPIVPVYHVPGDHLNGVWFQKT